MKTFIKIFSSCIIACLFVIVALGCASQQSVSYNVSLDSVESPADAKKQFGETKVVHFTDSSIIKYSYEDDYIAITWYVDYTQFNFNLRNKSEHTIKINWDDISYVNYNGQTGRVMHAGVKYNEKNNSQPSTMVPRGASISDILLPTDNVYFVSGQYGGWSKNPLIPRSWDKKADINDEASLYIGKTMTILMPLYIENVQNDYVFRFNIDSYNINKKK